MSKKLIVEIVGNKNYHFKPYPKKQITVESIPETISFNLENIANLENIVTNNMSITNNTSVTNNMSVSTNDVSELLKTLPFFGPDDNLPLFITKVESIIETLHQFSLTMIQSVLVKQSILSKIKGQAATNIFLENTSDWPHIKQALIKYYGDHRNENLLNSNLKQTRHMQNETSLQFYHKVIEAQNALIQFAQLHLTNAEILAYEINKIRLLSLEQFKIGIREPYRTLLSYVPPNTIEEALLKCHEHDNNQTAIRQLHNFQNLRQIPPTKNIPPQQSKQKVMESTPLVSNSFSPRQNFSSQPPYRPFGDINKSIPPRQHFPTNNQVFGTPRPSYSGQMKQNVHNNYKPTPMSTQTANPQPSSKQFTQPNKNFVSRELHNVEINDETPEAQSSEQNYYQYHDTGSYDYSEYPVYEYEQPESPDENFQELVSNPPSLI